MFGTGIGTRGVGLVPENFDENVKSEIKSVMFAILGRFPLQKQR